MYFRTKSGKLCNYKVESPVIERGTYGHNGRTSKTYWIVYESDESGEGVEKWRIEADMENLDILLGYVAAIGKPVLFGNQFLSPEIRSRIEATIDNAMFI